MSNTTEQNQQDKQRFNSKAATSSSDDDDDDDDDDEDEGETKLPISDDSLADFKSPKIKPINPPKILNNYKKPGPRCSKKNSNNNTIGQSSRGKKTTKETTNQLSIESTFFKQQSKTSFTCPLCFKSFIDANTQISHSKNCATKNNISTRRLLAATELQERQASERLELGLPAGPVRTVKRKTTNIKSMIPDGDPDIHLAMALSMSLKEMKQLEEFDEAVALVAESDDKFLEMSSSQRRSTLQSFGFKTNKPVIEAPIVKPKKRKNIGPTILETRTKETREQIITEKIAEIIVGIEQTTQARYEELNPPSKGPKKTEICSKSLKKWHRSDQKLWNHSTTSSEKSDYYVQELVDFFKLSEPDEQQNTGSNSEDNNNGEEDDDEMVVNTDTEEKSDKVEDEEMNSAMENEVTLQRSIEDDIDQSQMETEHENENVNDDSSGEDDGDENEPKTGSFKDNFMKNKKDKDSSVAVAYDWYKMVGSTYGSDVKILLKDDKYLPAHSIVFLARCRDVLNDIEECNKLYDKWKQVIRWQTIDITAATMFLEFLYCGRFLTGYTSNAKDQTDQLKSLARKYNVKQLCDYFKKKERDESKCRKILVKINEKKEPENLEKSQDGDDVESENVNNLVDEIENGKRENSGDTSGSIVQDKVKNNEMEKEKEKEEEEDDVWADESDFEMEFEAKIQDKVPQSQLDLNRKRMTCSPDLFDESVTFQGGISPSINNSVPEKTPDKSSHSTNGDTTPEIINKETEKTENTQRKSYTQVNYETPCSKSFSGRRKLPENILPKSKSDMTLFIEKVQRLNARDILDSDTDDDTPIENSKLPRKNPFKIRNDEDDSFFLFKKTSPTTDSNINNNESFIEEKKKSNVSMIEEKIRARAGSNLKKSQSAAKENVDTGELSTEIESDDSDDLGKSMFSKYQKQTASNSIVNYREMAKKYLLNTAELRTPPDSFDDSDLKIPDTSLEDDKELSDIENINFDEFSDMDMNEAIENSLADKNREQEKEKNDKENLENKPDSLIDLTQLSDFELEKSHQEHFNISDTDPPGMEVNDVYSSSSKANKTPENIQKSAKTSEPLSSTNIVDDLEFDSWSDVSKFAASPLTQSRVINTPEKEVVSQKNPEDNLSKDSNHDSDDEHYVTQNVQQSQEAEDMNKESPPLEFDPELNFPPLRLTQSPITLSSCSETSNLDNDFDGLSQLCEENNKNNSGNSKSPQGEFCITNLLNSPIIPRIETPSTSRNITFRSTRILKERPSQSVHTLSDNSDDDLPVASSTRCHSSLASPFVEKNTNSRYLAVKSKSDGNFVGSLKKKNTPITSKNKNNSSRISDVITPPLDYDGMTSPELCKELDKYGLKKQKRSKAKKLLINIYDKLHPFVSDENVPDFLANNNYLDNEPPRKKQCLETNYEDSDDDNVLSQESFASNSSIIPEEMEIDEQNYPSINQENLPIKELFNKFIKKNKNIHNKILTYEPLPLEDLFKKLKVEGFNGKLNELMDFLDDESITFQVQETNRNKDRQRKTKKTTQKK